VLAAFAGVAEEVEEVVGLEETVEIGAAEKLEGV
jgi:hypothetical protein